MNCEDCPVQHAYAQYVVNSNIFLRDGKEFELARELSRADRGIFKSMISEPAYRDPFAPDLRLVLEEDGCPGPAKAMFGLGKLSCRGHIDMVPETRRQVQNTLES